MKRSFAGLAILAVAICVTVSTAEESTYFPTKKGTAWTYKTGGNQVIVKVAGPDKIGNVDCIKLETYVGDKAQANEHIAITKDGIYRHAVNGQQPEKPIMFLKFAPDKLSPDEKLNWEVDTKILGQNIKGKFDTKKEKLKVGDKEYDTIVADGASFDISGKKATIKYWFADKVGIVKLQFAIDNQDATLELEKYEEGK
jgi:hypothetical protein